MLALNWCPCTIVWKISVRKYPHGYNLIKRTLNEERKYLTFVYEENTVWTVRLAWRVIVSLILFQIFGLINISFEYSGILGLGFYVFGISYKRGTAQLRTFRRWFWWAENKFHANYTLPMSLSGHKFHVVISWKSFMMSWTFLCLAGGKILWEFLE